MFSNSIVNRHKETFKWAPFLDLLVIVYGSSETDSDDESRFCGDDQRRVEVELSPAIPEEVGTDPHRLERWISKTVRETVLNIKHSQRWHCEFCDELARDTYTDIATWWRNVSPPKTNVYVHLLCKEAGGPCAELVRELSNQAVAMNRGRGVKRFPPPPMPLFPGTKVRPAVASCTKCKREETIELNMSRCAGCKLSRYCGVECQKEDWARHKLTCKAVRDVKWVWT